MANRTIRTANNRAALLAALAEGWSVQSATQRAGVGYRSYYDWRDDDPQFRAEADAAMEASTDLLEDEARRRAMDQSDLLLIFLLRSRRPAIYNRKTLEAVGSVAPPPLAIPHAGSAKRINFYIPTNNRHLPARDEVSDVIEAEPERGGTVDDDAA